MGIKKWPISSGKGRWILIPRLGVPFYKPLRHDAFGFLQYWNWLSGCAWAPTVFLQEITLNLPVQNLKKGTRVGEYYSSGSATVGMILGFGAGAAGVFELSTMSGPVV